MRRLLVTGGAGFIGGNYVQHRLRQQPDDLVVVFDALTYAGRRETLASVQPHAGFRFVHGDIADAALVRRVLAEFAIDTIVHFAAESHVDRSIAEPGVFIHTNVVGTQVLLDAAMDAWRVPSGFRPGVRFHHVSTDEVYGSLTPTDAPFTEDSPYQPSSPYAASKAASDHLVRAWHHTYGLPVSISNCSNNYGPFQFPEKLVPLLLLNALHGRPLPIYGDGQQVRDWLFVSDHCAAIDRLLEAPVVGATFNVGGRSECTNLTLVSALCERLDARFAAEPALRTRFPECPAARGDHSAELVSHVTDRRGHDRRYAIDPTRLERVTGAGARWTLAEGLEATVSWYLERDDWWGALYAA